MIKTRAIYSLAGNGRCASRNFFFRLFSIAKESRSQVWSTNYTERETEYSIGFGRPVAFGHSGRFRLSFVVASEEWNERK